MSVAWLMPHHNCSSGRMASSTGDESHRWQRNWGGEGIKQLVLPRECQQHVIQLANSVPMAGHLGGKRTMARVTQRFYWPSMYQDIAQYCYCCKVCQRCWKHKSPRAPMIPLPVIQEPLSVWRWT